MKKSYLTSALVCLAALGAATYGYKKTSPIAYEEALKKAGVQIEDNIATLIESGEKYTGKIERFVNRNKKETIEFKDGIIKEKLYHNLFGKELEGYFYKDGKEVLKIWKSVGQQKNNSGFSYSGENVANTKSAAFIATKDGFEWARKFISQTK